MIKAVIFDLDDTLISERKYIESGYRHISKLLTSRLGKSELELYELLIKLFSQSPKNVFNRLFDTLEKPYTKGDILELVGEYRSHIPLIEFYIDVLPCIEVLKKKGLKLGIITDGYAIAQRQKIEAVQASKLFDEIIITDELGREYWKPHPKAFEMMKGKLDVEYNEMIYVGDNPEKDFYISEIYPISTLRIMREDSTYINAQYYKNVKEHEEIYDLSELKEYIMNLDGLMLGMGR